MNTATIPSVVNDYAAAINSLDIDSYANNFATNATAYEPVGSPAYEGDAGVRQFFEATSSLFASINFRWTFVHVVDNEVVSKWQAEGVGKNGQSVEFEGIDQMLYPCTTKVNLGCMRLMINRLTAFEMSNRFYKRSPVSGDRTFWRV
jgi:ketosteroid isomerase-like protein